MQSELIQMVDDLITPERADIEAAAFVKLMSLVADRDDRVKDEAFLTATTHAFSKTTAFQHAYNQFVGPCPGNKPPNDVIETGKTV